MTPSLMNKILFKELHIEHICKTTLKNSYISVKRDSKIILKTPKVSSSYIHALLCEKEQWIRKQLKNISKHPPKTFNLEDEVLLFGETISIDIDEVQDLRVALQKIEPGNTKKTLDAYDKFYKSYATKHLTPMLEYYANIMDLNYKEVKFRKMKSRWGSCSSDGIITLNTALVKIKRELINYVIVHELAHLVHMNHSKKFHLLVEKYLPNTKIYKKELKNITF